MVLAYAILLRNIALRDVLFPSSNPNKITCIRILTDIFFIFDIKNLITAHLPQQIKDLLYKQFDDNTIVRIDHERIKKTIGLDLDDLLEKIKDYGVESLTEDEKNFLDNFKN